LVSRTLIDIHLLSNQQLNFADPGTNLADEIGKFGNPHPDFQDNETSLTFMFNFSYLQSKDHGGRFVVPGLSVAIPLKSRSIINFSARYLHFALPIIEYSVPENSPLRCLSHNYLLLSKKVTMVLTTTTLGARYQSILI
jgi:hypothetical protein